MIILIIIIITHPPTYFRVQVDRQDTHTAGIQRGQAVALHEGRADGLIDIKIDDYKLDCMVRLRTIRINERVGYRHGLINL